MKTKADWFLKSIMMHLVVIAVFFLNGNCLLANNNRSYVMKNESYEKEWEKVTTDEKKGLTKSAFQKVQVIYEKAKRDTNSPQVIKSLLHIIKYKSILEDAHNVAIIRDIEKQLESYESPAKEVLSSVLAEFYYHYYQSNRYRFLKRTAAVQFDQDDIETWDLEKILENISSLYMVSLENEQLLKDIPAGHFEAILVKGTETEQLRPTLYDFLAHRALDFFAAEEPSLTKPVYQFQLDDERFFAAPREFSKLKIKTKDTASLKYKAGLILQDLIKFHLKDKQPDALVDADIRRLHFVGANAVLPNKDTLYLEALKKLEKKHEGNPVAAPITYEIAWHYYNIANKYVPGQRDEYKWKKKEALELCKPIIEKYPNTLGGKKCAYLQNQILKKSISITTEEVTIPDKPSLSLVTYRNIDVLYFKIFRLTEKERKEAKAIANQGKLLSFYKSKEQIHGWEIDLPNDGDYNQHKVEIKLPALEPGYYVILAGTDNDLSHKENAVAYAGKWISNISYAQQYNPDDGSYRIRAVHRNKGYPLADVTAQAYEYVYNYTLRRQSLEKKNLYKTDKDGLFTIPAIPSGQRSRTILFDFGLEGDRLFLDRTTYQDPYHKPEHYPYRVMVFSDRSIYRPGQTIYFKGIALRTKDNQNEIIENFSIKVIFNDPNHQKIHELELTTNEYGTFSGTFTAPVGRLNGNMYLYAVDNDNRRIGNHSVSVEEYKRPKFEVEFLPLTGSFRLNEKVTVKGSAKSYAGSAIDNAAVQYRVVRKAVFPDWMRWWGYFLPQAETEIAHGMTTTEKSGEFEIAFDAIPDPEIPEENDPRFNYAIHADVVDISGETHSAQTNVTVGYVSLNISVPVPAKVEQHNQHTFNIHSVNLQGEPEDAKGTIVVHKLKDPATYFMERKWAQPDVFTMSEQEFKKEFPHHAYKEENKYTNWPKTEKVYNTTFDTRESKEIEFNKMGTWKQGAYLLELQSKDAFGGKVTYKTFFTLFSSNVEKLPYPQLSWFTAYPAIDKPKEPGDTVVFECGSSAKNATVFYELVQDGTILQQKSIALSEEKKQITIPIEESYRGNISIQCTFTHHNRFFHENFLVQVPWSNKELDIAFETFRDKLLPGQNEQWRLKIADAKGDKIAAEMVAALYDASLDAFRPHAWHFSIYPSFGSRRAWNSFNSFSTAAFRILHNNWNPSNPYPYFSYNVMNTFNSCIQYQIGGFERGTIMASGTLGSDKAAPLLPAPEMNLRQKKGRVTQSPINTNSFPEYEQEFEQDELKDAESATGPEKTAAGAPALRTNFNETAFFYPHLKTNENGDVIIEFTIPEALTTWKMLGFAHTKDLSFGLIDTSLVTQKELMVMPNVPRFFREGDTILFGTKISNLTKKQLSGTATLELYDAMSMKKIDTKVQNTSPKKRFEVKENQSTAVTWKLAIPAGVQAVTYRVYAKAGNHSDGEESTLPVLTNRMLVTESTPLPVRKKGTKTFTMQKLIDAGKSSTLQHEKLTLEFTPNPVWYAIQALPYLMEYPYECAEQIFSRYYANSIASHMANSNPKIKAVFEEWKDTDALLSNLQKNQVLKSLLLEETPWIMQAKSEEERKKRIGVLFDLTRMAGELEVTMRKLREMQTPNGGWPWFAGLPDDRFITQHITAGMGHLTAMKIISEDNSKIRPMLHKAAQYLDDRIREDYDDLVRSKAKLEDDHLGYVQIHYLYARSFFTEIPVAGHNEKAYSYWKDRAREYWVKKNKYMQGMIALALFRDDDSKTANDILRSLKENAIHHDEMGMYWKENDRGYYWYQAPIETQALLIEAFSEIANDTESVDALKVWLLKHKQVQDWKTTKATADACYALLLTATDLITEDNDVVITVGGEKVSADKAEAGTGYFKKVWAGEDVNENMGTVTVAKKENSVSWGALYWQYFEQLDKITTHETPLQLTKKLFVQKNSPKGPVIEPITSKTTLKPGDLIKVRIELRVERSMEYVHMKDMRASGLEPIDVLSTHKYRDGLWYYESTKDAATNFFIPRLTKGTYVFEYPLRVTHEGDFSNGITSIQCMYAPEFTSHSEGVRIQVGE